MVFVNGTDLDSYSALAPYLDYRVDDLKDEAAAILRGAAVFVCTLIRTPAECFGSAVSRTMKQRTNIR
jgi:hypothetical protein